MFRIFIKYATRFLIFTCAFFIGIAKNGNAQNSGSRLLWQIGEPDNGIAEFALAPNGVGRSTAKSNWPYCHPGPDDVWAGNKQHTFSILFGIKDLVKAGDCKLKFRLIDVGNTEVKLSIRVNGQEYQSTLPKGAGKAIWGAIEEGKKYEFETDAVQFATGLSQPLIVTKANGRDYSVPKVQLSSKDIVVLVLKPSEDGKAWIVTLFNPSGKKEKTTLHWSEPVKATSYSNTGEKSLRPVTGEIEMDSLEVVTVRADK
jgi:hypothetical protein